MLALALFDNLPHFFVLRAYLADASYKWTVVRWGATVLAGSGPLSCWLQAGSFALPVCAQQLFGRHQTTTALCVRASFPCASFSHFLICSVPTGASKLSKFPPFTCYCWFIGLWWGKDSQHINELGLKNSLVTAASIFATFVH